MKKFLIVIISLIISFAVVLSGCTTTIWEVTSSGGSSSGSSSGGSSSGVDTSGASETSYTVTLVLPDGETEMPDLTDIQAKWTSGTSVYTAGFNSTGFAYCDGLDGEYSVTISGLIDGYSYNPNIYDTSSGKDVSIQLIALQSFYGQDGSSVKDEGLALAYDTGVYRIEFTSASQRFYFMFLPNLSTTGYTYSVQTYADTIENEICPTFYLYAYSNRSLVGGGKGTITGGSNYNGSYTKNIYYELDMSTYTPSTSYNSYIYAFSIKSTNSEYPKYLDIVLTCEREYTDDDYWESVGGKYSYAETDTSQIKDFDAPTGTQTWITDVYKDFSYIETEVGSDGYYYIIYNGERYLLYVELEGCHLSSAPYDFSNGYAGTLCRIIGVYYYNVVQDYSDNAKACNSSGIHPVTAQLHDMLYYYSAQYLFNDTNGSGTYAGKMESLGYASNDANQWLYACCFYT